MKRRIFRRLLLGLVIFANVHSFAQNYVSLQNKRFYLKGKQFFPVGVDYEVDIVQDGSGGFYPAPNHSYGPSPTNYPSSTAAGNLQAIKNDFQALASYGVTTIRLLGFDVVHNSSGTGFTVPTWPNPENYANSTPLAINTPYSGNPSINPVCANYFSIISQVIAAATANNIYVMLVAGGGPNCTASSNYTDYGDYLTALSTNFSTNATIFAYDIFNEPAYFAMPEPANKEGVCTVTGYLYNALKSGSPNQLVTIGDVGPLDVDLWDPGVVNVDFVCFHPYPYPITVGSGYSVNFTPYYDPTNAADVSNDMNNMLSQIYWFGNNVSLPWMLSETGFSCLPDGTFTSADQLDGSFTDQANYVTEALNAVVSSTGAGCLFWQFHDVQWGATAEYENNYGLFDFNGNPKPAMSSIQNFNPSAKVNFPTPPGDYYNYWGYSKFTATGNVIDQNGNPIQGAYVEGWTDIGKLKFQDNVSTVTDVNGNFSLTTQDLEFDEIEVAYQNTNVVLLRVSNTSGHNSGPFNFTLNLASNALNENFDFSGLTISTTQGTVAAENSISAGNNYFVTSPSGNITLEAGKSITLTNVFDAQAGSYFDAKYGLPAYSCTDPSYHRRGSNTSVNNNNNNNNNGSSTASVNSFLLREPNTVPDSIPVVYVSPNPTIDGEPSVYISLPEKFNEIEVTDLLGQVVQTIANPGTVTKLNLDKNQRGIYMVKVAGPKNVFVHKLIYE